MRTVTVTINQRFYKIRCTANQADTLSRLSYNALNKGSDSDKDDYATLVKLLMHAHKRRVKAKKALQLTFDECLER